MSDELAYGVAAGASAVYFFIVLLLYVLLIVAQWKLFTKAGEAGWKSLIPIYNMYVMFQIIYGNGIKFLLLLIPFFNIIVEIAMMIRLAQVYGKGVGFGIGLIFFPNIFTLILAFGDSTYVGPVSSFI